jgi:oligopeptide/dipeptide ABC transporter ATP-binding protein
MGIEMLKIKGLKKYYSVKETAFSGPVPLRAVDGVDFSVKANRVFSIVGESGCGKSTVARLIMRLIRPTGGSVEFKGDDLFSLKGDGLKAFRRSVQIIFQDPFASLNPRRTVFQTLSEPLKIHGLADKTEYGDRVAELLRQVGLEDVMHRYPHEFSGGQRQRICIARALSVSPELIVADEPLSALDVSIQAQIINLLIELKERAGLSYVFISHDLRVVRYLSDEVAVMYLGRIVEQGPSEEIFASALHPYTHMLLASAPSMKPHKEARVIAGGDVPSPVHIPPGCPFHPRCPEKFEPCDRERPDLITRDARSVACHLHG